MTFRLATESRVAQNTLQGEFWKGKIEFAYVYVDVCSFKLILEKKKFRPYAKSAGIETNLSLLRAQFTKTSLFALHCGSYSLCHILVSITLYSQIRERREPKSSGTGGTPPAQDVLLGRFLNI